jgi:mono/diheme cytochrome c family protein
MRVKVANGLQLGRRAAEIAVWTAILLVLPVTWSLQAQTRTTSTQSAIAGARVFGSKNCVECHAIDGLGGTEGPDLAQRPKARTFYELAAAMWNHRPRMVERMRERDLDPPRLNERETGDLMAFLYTLDYFDAPGDVERGGKLFADKQCVMCHQVGGVGGVFGPDLGTRVRYAAPIQVAAAMWNHGPAMSTAMAEQGIRRPRFTGAELADLIAYLESDKPQHLAGPLYVLPGLAGDGRRVFVERGCSSCHAVGGSGGRLAPDLAERRAHSSLISFAAAMWNKAPQMMRAMRARGVSVPQLEPEEMADLVGYLYSLQYFTETGSPDRGPRRLREKGCLACHSLRGQRESVGGDIAAVRGLSSPAAVIAALWNHTRVDAEAVGGSRAWPTFTATEMADLVLFLQSLDQGR